MLPRGVRPGRDVRLELAAAGRPDRDLGVAALEDTDSNRFVNCLHKKRALISALFAPPEGLEPSTP